MEHISEETIGNYILRTYYDSSPESPREWDNLGTIVASHPRYTLSDKDAPRIDFDDFGSWEEAEQYLKKEYAAKIILPVYMYEHGGVALSTSPFSCLWDSGKVGFIYITKEKILSEISVYGGKIVTKKLREKLEGCLSGEIEAYSKYLNGEVYGYRVFKVDLEGEEEEIDSCWGYFSEGYAIEEAKDQIRYAISEDFREDLGINIVSINAKNQEIETSFSNSYEDTAYMILAKYGEEDLLHEIAKNFFDNKSKLVAEYSNQIDLSSVLEENFEQYDQEIEELNQNFKADLEGIILELFGK